MKKLALLGSTGSIAHRRSTLCAVYKRKGSTPLKWRRSLPIPIFGFWKSRSGNLNPQAVAVFDLEAASKLRAAVRDLNVKVYSGMEGLCALTELESVDIVLNSVVGMVGLKPDH